jgi:hypothetical protein
MVDFKKPRQGLKAVVSKVQEQLNLPIIMDSHKKEMINQFLLKSA